MPIIDLDVDETYDALTLFLYCIMTQCCNLVFSEVGDVVGVADSTIRQSYRLLYPEREKLFPTDFVFSVPLDSLPKH